MESVVGAVSCRASEAFLSSRDFNDKVSEDETHPSSVANFKGVSE